MDRICNDVIDVSDDQVLRLAAHDINPNYFVVLCTKAGFVIKFMADVMDEDILALELTDNLLVFIVLVIGLWIFEVYKALQVPPIFRPACGQAEVSLVLSFLKRERMVFFVTILIY
jgi:hypothetical protein